MKEDQGAKRIAPPLAQWNSLQETFVISTLSRQVKFDLLLADGKATGAIERRPDQRAAGAVMFNVVAEPMTDDSISIDGQESAAARFT